MHKDRNIQPYFKIKSRSNIEIYMKINVFYNSS
jgi:hypothetical protein